ncbi:MAG: tyrosine-type recombinase/integrase [Clostridiales bacterium]|nr:tyrosine-type recombinase/integrase [Clostridiales bacterium]
MDILKKIDDNGLGSILVKSVTECQLKEFFFGLTDYSNSYISKIYSEIKNCFKYCSNPKHKIIDHNIFDDFEKPKSKKRIKKITALTVDEQLRFVEILNNQEKNNRYRFQMLLMLYSGMRMGEINALTINDVSFDFRTIKISKPITRDKNDRPILGDRTKTASGERTIRMTAEAYDLLLDFVKNHYVPNAQNLIFYDNTNQKVISTSRVNFSFKHLIDKYQIIQSQKIITSLAKKRNARHSANQYF